MGRGCKTEVATAVGFKCREYNAALNAAKKGDDGRKDGGLVKLLW